MIFIVIYHQETIYTLYMTAIIFFKILNLFKINFIYYLIILAKCNNSIGRKRAVLILKYEVILTGNHDKRRYGLAVRINTLDHCDLFVIIRLYYFHLTTPFRTCNNHSKRDLNYYKSSLVKVPNIIFIYSIYGYHVAYEVKPLLYYSYIFAFSPLIIIFTRELRMKL